MNRYKEDRNYYYDIIRVNIRKYRKEKGLTQEVLANKINYSKNYINEIENLSKKKSFSLIVVGRIADVLDIDIKEFFRK